jgi:hypothetical protein
MQLTEIVQAFLTIAQAGGGRAFPAIFVNLHG